MCRQTARASPAAPSPVRLPTFSEDFSNEDKVDILLSVNDTINGKIGEKISALLDEQEATAAAAGSIDRLWGGLVAGPGGHGATYSHTKLKLR